MCDYEYFSELTGGGKIDGLIVFPALSPMTTTPTRLAIFVSQSVM